MLFKKGFTKVTLFYANFKKNLIIQTSIHHKMFISAHKLIIKASLLPYLPIFQIAPVSIW